MTHRPPATQQTLADAARAVRAACPACRALRRGELPCEACVRAVVRIVWRRSEERRRGVGT
jgi:hypothetical protein